MKFTKTLFIVLILLTSTAFGGDPGVSILSAKISCNNELSIVFDKSLPSLVYGQNPDECAKKSGSEDCKGYEAALGLIGFLRNHTNYKLLRLDDQSFIGFTGASWSAGLENEVILTIGSGFDAAKSHYLIAKKLSSSGDAVMIKVGTDATCQSPVGSLPKLEEKKSDRPEDLVDVALKTKENTKDPVWKFSFGLDGAKSRKSVYSFSSVFKPFVRRRDGLGGFYEWTYIVATTEVKFNSAESDRKNVLNVGTEFSLTNVFDERGQRLEQPAEKRPKFPGFTLKYSPQVETEWGFKELNILPFNLRFTLPVNLYQSRRSRIRIDPFVGFESGATILSKVNKPGWTIARGLVGADLRWGFLRRGKNFVGELEVSYIRRFLASPEFSWGVVETDRGAYKEVPDIQSRRPRDHALAKLTFNAGFVKPFIQYEYGRVPPRFVLQRHAFKTGLEINADFFWKRDR